MYMTMYQPGYESAFRSGMIGACLFQKTGCSDFDSPEFGCGDLLKFLEAPLDRRIGPNGHSEAVEVLR